MRLPLAARRLGYRFRGGFLVRPVLIAVGLGAAGAVLSAAEEAVPAIRRAVPSVLFPSAADPQVAQVILACIATSTMSRKRRARCGPAARSFRSSAVIGTPSKLR